MDRQKLIDMKYDYDYTEEAKTNEWQRKSGHIKERDNYTCLLCGSSNKQVHAHHCFYENGRHYWDYPDESLITLCEECHEKETILNEKRFLNFKETLNTAILKARHAGVTSIKIIDAINALAEENNLHRPDRPENVEMYESKINTHKEKQTYYLKTANITERKKEFLKELSSYGLRYDTDYIQNFANYWTEAYNKKLRFESDESFQLPVALSNWKEKMIEVRKEKEYEERKSAAEIFAKKQWEQYHNYIDSLIAKAKEEVDANFIPIKEQLLDMFYSKEDEMKKTKMKSLIPSYQNPDTTVYYYLLRSNRPAGYAEIYKTTENGNKTKNSLNAGVIVKTCTGNNTQLYPDMRNIKAIENYFEIKLWLPIPFTQRIPYVIDYYQYFVKQRHRYMMQFEEYKERHLKLDEESINLDDFQLLYEAQQAFQINDKDNLRKLEDIEDISLVDFCKVMNIEMEYTEDISLKAYLKRQMLFSEEDKLLHSIKIIPCLEHFRIAIADDTQSLALILEKMNKHYATNFLIPFSKKEYKVFMIPSEILYKANDFLFDYSFDSFINGTMTSILLPEHLQTVDYYYNKIQELDKKTPPCKFHYPDNKIRDFGEGVPCP